MPSKSKTITEINFDRRSSSPRDFDRGAADRQGDRRATPRVARTADATPSASPDTTRQRRTTRDGRQPLVVYLQPQSIKALKIFALENDTTASAVVAEAVISWLRTQSKH